MMVRMHLGSVGLGSGSTVWVGRQLDSVGREDVVHCGGWEVVDQCQGLGGGALGGGWTVWVGRWLDRVGWEVV